MVEQALRKLGIDLRSPPPPPRAGWEQHLVASKPAGEGWPIEAANRIAAARRCYEAGTHEMTSCTRGGWTQLYCVPRKQPAHPRSYFTMAAE